MIVLIDSGGANIASIRFALQRCGVDSQLTDDADVIANAQKVILPGVGAAQTAMAQLQSSGLVECIRGLKVPVLGICLGMQLLFEHSSEGDTPLLGIIDGVCDEFEANIALSVPHMGWNRLNHTAGGVSHALLRDVPDGAHVYFVHGFRVPAVPDMIASCTYGGEFTALVAKDNFMGAQFHPERSGLVGAQILQNFIDL